MANVIIEEIERTIIEGHPIIGTEKITFKYAIENNGETIIRGISSLKVNQSGVFIDNENLHNQISDEQVVKLLITVLKDKYRQND